jgi:FkbM family methyltransferase
MFFSSYNQWNFVTWFSFWFGTVRKVRISNYEISVRAGNYANKISDLAMAWEVFVDNVYDVFDIANDDVLVDIGGHIGSFTIKAASKCPAGHVYTFEPYTPTFLILDENVKGINNVTIFNKAVSDHSGSQRLYISHKNPAENSLIRTTDTHTTVELISLNDIFSNLGIDHIDLLKLDCEGAEYKIISTAKTNLDYIKKIVMEVHEPKYFNISPEFTIQKLINTLETAGFYVNFKRENKYQGYIYAHKVESAKV